MTLQRDQFDSPTAQAVHATDSNVLIENCTFVSNGISTPVVNLDGTSKGAIRFNSFADLAATSQPAVTCPLSAQVAFSSNILAWNGIDPSNCMPRYSLFSDSPPGNHGSNSISANVQTFFVGLANKNLHLAVGSPAIGTAEPNLPTTTDLDGNARPANPDIGAYEAP